MAKKKAAKKKMTDPLGMSDGETGAGSPEAQSSIQPTESALPGATGPTGGNSGGTGAGGRQGSTPTKADLIRAYVAEHPGASATDIVAGLAAQGVTIPVPAITSIRKKGTKKSTRKSTGRPPKTPVVVSGHESKGHLSHAEAFIKEAGGIQNAIQILTLVKSISERKLPL